MRSEEDDSERVTLPRLFGAILRLLFLLAAVTSPEVSVNAFVLDFSDAYWQIPLRDDERKFSCATAKIKGNKSILLFFELHRAAPTPAYYGEDWPQCVTYTITVSSFGAQFDVLCRRSARSTTGNRENTQTECSTHGPGMGGPGVQTGIC